MVRCSLSLLLLWVWNSGNCQLAISYADSLRTVFHVPEMAYSVVRADSVLELAVTGKHAIHLSDKANINDRFHLGSNTKALTAFVIAHYVELGKLTWDTRFFDLFPEWKKNALPVYHAITLKMLLSHRAGIQPFLGENDPPLPVFKGNRQQKRMAFGRFVLSLPPAKMDSSSPFIYSNAGYALAAIMLEKVTGKSWELLMEKNCNNLLKLGIGFSWPENQKQKDTWGHFSTEKGLIPVPSDTSFCIDLAEPAGDINIKLKDYARYIQLNLKGLNGENNYLKSTTYQFLHEAFEGYAMGWFNVYENGNGYSSHSGTDGTYYAMASIDRTRKQAYIVFVNVFNEEATIAVRWLTRRLKQLYPAK